MVNPLDTSSIEVAIEYDDPRYWIMIFGAVVFGLVLNKFFDRATEDARGNYLVILGFAMVTLQLYIPITQALDPDYTFSYHRNLPLHFCSVNFWLIAFNCFLRNRMLFVLTTYMGITGGFHSFMTCLLYTSPSPRD